MNYPNKKVVAIPVNEVSIEKEETMKLQKIDYNIGIIYNNLGAIRERYLINEAMMIEEKNKLSNEYEKIKCELKSKYKLIQDFEVDYKNNKLILKKGENNGNTCINNE